MRKKWIYRKLEAFGIYPRSKFESESAGARGQELEGTFGGDGSGRVGRIRNEDDQCYRRMSSIFFPYLFFSITSG
jgi:hypothetical protein